MPADDEAAPEVRVVGGGEPWKPRKPASDLQSIRARAERPEASGADPDTTPADEPARQARSSSPGPSDRRRQPGASEPVDRTAFNVLLGTVGLLVALLLLSGAGWIFGWGKASSKKVVLSAGSADVRSMSGVARTFLTAFTNYDPDSIDRIYNQINGLATGDFAKEWPTLFPDNVRQEIRTRRAQVRGEIANFFVQDFTGDGGEVYAVVNVTYANNSRPQPTADTLRFDVKLLKVDGDWKLSVVNLLTSPAATSGVGDLSSGTTTPSTSAPSTTSGH